MTRDPRVDPKSGDVTLDVPPYIPLRPPLSRISENTRRAENAARISARAVRDADKAMAEMRSILALTRRLQRPWSRPCWICGALTMCGHREPELVEVWQR